MPAVGFLGIWKFAGDVIVTIGLPRMHFPRPGIF